MKEPVWISFRDTSAIHARLLELHGGAGGIRDRGLLESALARPRPLHAYRESPGLPDMAAAYTVGIIRNHPFVDGNKRTGFVVGTLFLEVNGCAFHANEEAVVRTVLALAAGDISEKDYGAFLRQNPDTQKK